MPPLSPVDNYDGSNIKYCSQEMCLPSEELVKGRICVTAIDHSLDGAEEAVTNIIVVAAQTFLKNIITAMLSRTAGYKIRENNFQHAIGVPVASPWLRNTTNIIDVTQETNVTVNDDEQTFEPHAVAANRHR
ncbi:transcriptional Adaptor 1-2 [Carabus blaptoides fortunei]